MSDLLDIAGMLEGNLTLVSRSCESWPTGLLGLGLFLYSLGANSDLSFFWALLREKQKDHFWLANKAQNVHTLDLYRNCLLTAHQWLITKGGTLGIQLQRWAGGTVGAAAETERTGKRSPEESP